MRAIQVRNVPDRTHAVLRRRAAASGMSLQEYLLKLLTESAATPTAEEVLARIEAGAEGRTGGKVGLEQAVRDIRADRDGR